MSSESRSPFAFEKPRWQAGSPFWLLAAVFGVSMFAACELCRVFAAPFDSYVGFWLPSGVYMAALLLTETRRWPLVALVALPATLASDLMHLSGFLLSVGFFIGNTVEVFTGAYLIRRFGAARPALRTIREFLAFLAFGAVLAPAVGATIGATVILCTGNAKAFGAPWLTWCASEAIGILLVAPVILTSLAPDRPLFLPRVTPKRGAEVTILFSLIVVMLLVVATEQPVVASTIKYALLPLLLWSGIRFGVRGAAVANLIQGVVLGYFAAHAPQAAGTGVMSSLLPSNLYTFLFVSVLVSLGPAVVLRERDSLLARLRSSEENVRLLLEGVQDCAIFMLDGEGRVASWTSAASRLTGYLPEEIVGRPVSVLIPADQQDASSTAWLL